MNELEQCKEMPLVLLIPAIAVMWSGTIFIIFMGCSLIKEKLDERNI
jgi:hypothetical protein